MSGSRTASAQSAPAGDRARSRFIAGAGRALGGALVFALPMLMTMELWQLGFYMDPLRLVLLLVVNIPMLVLLSRYVGFEDTRLWRDDVRDAAIAYGIGAVVGAAILAVLGALTPDMPLREIVGKIAVQAVPASIGALLARSELGGDREPNEVDAEETYAGELFLMAVGALFLGFNVAPTEEMLLIAYQMSEWHAIALVLLSILLMHGFVFAVEFKGGTELSPDTPWWSALMRFTLPGYLVAVLISFYLLWTFGRTDDASAAHVVSAVIVLAFPSSIGAAAARLIL